MSIFDFPHLNMSNDFFRDSLKAQGREFVPENQWVKPEPIAEVSPARLLASSLADEETRGEWVKRKSALGYDITNVKRNITLAFEWVTPSWQSVSPIRLDTSPFRLNAGEKALVWEAVDQWIKWDEVEKETAAIKRLTEK